MLAGGKSTLTQYLIEERRRVPEASGDLNALVTGISLACKAISRRVAYGSLDGGSASRSFPGSADAPSQPPTSLPVIAHEMFLRANEWGGHVAGMLSQGHDEPCPVPQQFPSGKYLLLFNALDGAPNAEVNVTVGSIFSIVHAPRPGQRAEAPDFLQRGSLQVCAGYAIYGPATMLVLTMGNGTHAFTLDPLLGEWVLSHSDLQIPRRTREFAINASKSRFWEPAVKRYVDECLAGQPGVREADFSMRWIASLVAETHRILMCGGVF
ncbi:MAG: fructose-1,6-bisphosphatase, partial [Comamonadaceae bacterium]